METILQCNQVLVSIKRAKIEAMRGANERAPDNRELYGVDDFVEEVNQLEDLEIEVTAGKIILRGEIEDGKA